MSLVTTIIWSIEIKVYLLSQNLIFRGVVNKENFPEEQFNAFLGLREREDAKSRVCWPCQHIGLVMK